MKLLSLPGGEYEAIVVTRGEYAAIVVTRGEYCMKL